MSDGFPDEMLAGFAAGTVSADIRPIGELVYRLSPQEQDCVQNAVASRQREFAAGRGLAHRCLEELGGAVTSLLVDADRCPVWPSAFVGSISHTATHVGAIVADASKVDAIGLDIESRDAVTPDLFPVLFTDEERDAIQDHAADSDLATRLFVAKEAFYKAMFPRHRLDIDFHQVQVRVDGPLFSVTLDDALAARIALHASGGIVHAADGYHVALYVQHISNGTH